MIIDLIIRSFLIKRLKENTEGVYFFEECVIIKNLLSLDEQSEIFVE